MAQKLMKDYRKIIVVEKTNENNVVVKENYVICEVCGHSNKQTEAICKKCSNYLNT